MLVGESTGTDFVKNLEETMMQEVGEHYAEYTLYKEGHSKCVIQADRTNSLVIFSAIEKWIDFISSKNALIFIALNGLGPRVDLFPYSGITFI